MTLSAAIILAAGEGSRLRSKTAKALHSLAGHTFLERVMTSVSSLAPDMLSVVVRHEREAVIRAARNYNDQVIIVDQDEIPGTGRAVQCAMKDLTALGLIDGTVLVVACDMPLLSSETLVSLLDKHHQDHNDATILTTILENPHGYGRIIRDERGNFVQIVEQRDGNAAELAIREVNTSVYLVNAQMLADAIKGLNSDNSQGEFYLTDALEQIAKHGRVGAYPAADTLSVQGVNDRVQLATLTRQYNQRICEHWMRAGVTIIDPATTWIEDTVTLAQDVIVQPGSYLQGNTVVNCNAVIGPETTLIDTVVGAGASIERSKVEGCTIGNCATIGPWTYLRPGNTLADETKAGAFVEMKKSQIGVGSKVPHLSYIGDTTIGEHTNVGGGTITANYDGVAKHATTIGSDVHVGAGNLFVAPVSLGDGVTTGAGSVIRHDVQAHSLAYSENTQHVHQDWHKE